MPVITIRADKSEGEIKECVNTRGISIIRQQRLGKSTALAFFFECAHAGLACMRGDGQKGERKEKGSEEQEKEEVSLAKSKKISLTETHHGGVLMLISNRPTPWPALLTLRSQSTIAPSTDAVISTSGENAPYAPASSTGGPRGLLALVLAVVCGAIFPAGSCCWPAVCEEEAFGSDSSASGSSSNSGSNDASDLASSSSSSPSCADVFPPPLACVGGSVGGGRMGPSGRTATMATWAPCDVNLRACWPVFRSHCYSYGSSVRGMVQDAWQKARTHVHIAVPTRAKEAHLVVLHRERRHWPAMSVQCSDELPRVVADGE